MLPGKLCIGILEEDNPLKSYFRMKPLLVEADGRYVPFAGKDFYPEDGCLRIVPDKNESSHFKARMRRMGRYCVLDLREHAGENDKIRPNKNYRNDDGERNSHIVYSDVVREPADDMIFEIVAGLAEGEMKTAPETPRLVNEKLETWVYTPGEGENPGTAAPDGAALKEEEIQRIEIEGFGSVLSFAIRLPGTISSVIQQPAARAEAPKAEAAPAEPAPESEKPWLSREFEQDVKLSLALQTGLNPRRNRSLQEIIEEKWRHSRVDQLGHPVPVHAMGKPVEDPVDAAISAIERVWENPEIRGNLVNRIIELKKFAYALEMRKDAVENNAIKQELEDLEAERLKTLHDLEHLRRDKQALRETFKQEIRTEEAEAFKDYVEKTQRAQSEYEKFRSMADEARKTVDQAKDVCRALKDGRFEEELKQFALTSHAAKFFSSAANQDAPVMSYATDDLPGREEWIQRVISAFENLGLDIDRLQAVNLLVCIALNGKLLLSGVAASDKRGTALAIARALGAEAAGAYARCDDGEFKPMHTEAISVTFMRGFNAEKRNLPCCCVDNQVLLCELFDPCAGYPVSAEVLESCFLIRLSPVDAAASWAPRKKAAVEYSPVRMDALRRAFLKEEASVPEILEKRMQSLRNALKNYGVYLSRRTLDLMWRYCAAMADAGVTTAEDAFDLAFAQRAMPCVLAQAPVECQADMKQLLCGMPRSLALLDQPLPIMI